MVMEQRNPTKVIGVTRYDETHNDKLSLTRPLLGFRSREDEPGNAYDEHHGKRADRIGNEIRYGIQMGRSPRSEPTRGLSCPSRAHLRKIHWFF